MATPIPYIIKKGDSLSKISQKLGIDNWQNLRTYHNNNCQPISEQIAEQLKEGKTLLTPSQDEIDKMNGKSQEIVEEKQDEEKEVAAHEESEKEQKQIQAEKSEHDKKYFVVHGAQCSCDQSEVPKKLAKLQVTTHAKVVFNDEDGKYAATEEDKTFDPMASTFGNCKLKPSGSSYLPCVIAPAPKWDKPYDKTKILGKKVLTEISELKCLTGGKIAVEKHGQTDAVLTQHAENTNALELAMANPALKMPPKKSDIPNVSCIIVKKIENHSGFKEVRSDKETGVEKIVARPHEEITFEAKLKSGNEKLVSWLVYEGHEGKNEQRLFLREQIGCEFKNSFEPGKYRVEGYGSPKEGKNDKNYPSASFDLEIAHNRLDGSALVPASAEFTIGSVGKYKLRKGFPASFDPKFLMEPTAEESDRLKMYVLDEAGNMASPFMVLMNQLAFTPKNSGAKYNFIAEYTDAEGNLSVQNYEAETIPNSVMGISHSDEIVRPLSNLQFSVTKTKFSVLVKSDADLTVPELSEIKWHLNGQLIGTGRTIAVTGILLAKPGDYVIEAFAISSNGFGRNAKKENDDWHFKVSENDVVSFTQNRKPKVGKWVTLTADRFVFQNLLPSEKVNWHIEGGDKLADSKTIQFKPSTAGIKNISCKINSQKGIRQSIAIKQAAINDVMFTDSNGLKIEKASWGQKINIWIEQKELIGEKLEIVVWDDDTGSPDDPVKTFMIPNYDGKLIPFSLDNSVKKLTGKNGAFYAKVKAPELTAINDGMKFPKIRLLVNDVKEIYSAQLGSEDGKEKHMIVDYDEISWFYAHTRGIKTDENLYLEIRDSVVGRDPLLLIVKNIKVDESGVIKVKINWALIKNKVSFLTVYAIVKENNADGKVLYDADGSFSMATAKLMKSSSLAKEAGYKSAVMVEGSSIPVPNNGTCVCKEYDLIWGNKVSCEFRKKVVEISKKQNFDPNHLMAVMAAETQKTFSTSKVELKPTGKLRPNGRPKKDFRGLNEKEINALPDGFEGAIGLIQFTPAAITALNDNYGYSLTKKKLAVMSQLVQLKYVEEYLALWKKINKVTGKLTLGDLYVLVFAPSRMNGSNDNTVLYKEGTEAYTANASVDIVDGNNDGEITKKELAKRAYDAYDEGNLKINKENKFSCLKENVVVNKDSPVSPGYWNIFAHGYSDRSVYGYGISILADDKGKEIFRFKVRLEGTGGRDRLITDSDTPTGVYNIPDNEPWIAPSSTGKKRKAYGPNHRLSLSEESGQIIESKRSLIRIHGGRQEDYESDPYTALQNPVLKKTNGCLRAYDSDMKTLKEHTDILAKEKKLKPGKLYVNDDLVKTNDGYEIP